MNKRIFSLLFAAIMVIGIFAAGHEVSAAGDIEITRINVDYNYAEGDVTKLESIDFSITGLFNTVKNYSVSTRYEGGTVSVGSISINNQNVGQYNTFNFTLPSSRFSNANIRLEKLYIDTIEISLSPAPKISKVNPKNVEISGSLTLEGQNLSSDNITISDVTYKSTTDEGTSMTYEEIKSSTPGFKNINIYTKGWYNGQQIINQYVHYNKAFKLIGNLDELGTLNIIPQVGVKGSTAYIITDKEFNPGEYSVFLLDKKDIDDYSSKNMATILGYSQDRKVMKIRIPESIEGFGSHKVQVTNRVTNLNANIEDQIIERKSVEEDFFIQQAENLPKIIDISPHKGPSKGGEVIVYGNVFEELSFIGGLEFNSASVSKVTTEKIEMQGIIESIVDIKDETNNDVRAFKIDYDIDGATYNGKDVDSITRYIYVLIGDKTEPAIEDDNKPKYSFKSLPDTDSITVVVPEKTVDKETDVDVIMVMQTKIKIGDKTHTLTNIITNENIKYTIQPSYVQPSINKINPEMIEVIPAGDGIYKLKNDIVIGIEGSNFKVTRYGTNGEYINYPIIGLGAGLYNYEEGIVLRVSGSSVQMKNGNGDNDWITLDGASIAVLDSNGNIVDGRTNRDTGSRIIITLPVDDIITVPEATVTDDPIGKSKLKPVYVINPILGSDGHGVPVSSEEVRLQFVYMAGKVTPTIDSVTPNIVAIDSGEEITIKGSNFHTNARVYIGGIEVNSVTSELDQSGMGKVIKFNAPVFPSIIEGKTKVMVVNPDGGTAIKDFTFVESLNMDPVITGFTPVKGTEGTIVVVDGDNFLKPSPQSESTGMGIYRLIGTRILMEKSGTGIYRDINDYNLDSNGNIVAIDYSNGNEKLIVNDNGVATLADYAHSILLQDKDGNYYIIYYDVNYNIILTDGGSSETGNNSSQYIIYVKNGELVAEKGGKDYPVSVSESGITIEDGNNTLTLNMKTPYKFNADTGEIYGSRVRVVDRYRLEFQVPYLDTGKGEYTITVQNPDTKKYTAKELFEYYEVVSDKPIIYEIRPSTGNIYGGYSIIIIGKNFYEDSKVYIDGILVTVKAPYITDDGKEAIEVPNVPPYRRNISQEGTNRKIVPVVVENDNGGTAIGRFTYIVPPSANPKIKSAEFQNETRTSGSAAGNEVLLIIGTDFRYEEPWSTMQKGKGWKEGTRNGQTIYYEDLNGDNNFTSYTDSNDYINQDGKTVQLEVPVSNYTYYLDSLVLPEVRIGGKKVNIVEFGPGFIKVITPQISPGTHELYIVNNDYGTSNKYPLTFTGSKPQINKIVPNVGKKQGREYVEITGSGFENSRVEVIDGSSKIVKNMPLVRFGNFGGTDDIDNNIAQVVLEKGNFVLDYKGLDLQNVIITLTLKNNNKTEQKAFELGPYKEGEYFLSVDTFDYELIKVKIEKLNLIVERGYSPDTQLINEGHITLLTPSYYTIGQVPVEVINPDGGIARGTFEYKNPDSKPKITNITRDGQEPVDGDDTSIKIVPVHYQGGSIITVEGEDFRENAIIQIGDVLTINPKDIQYNLPNKLTFTIPAVSEGALGRLHKVVVINEDGGTASSDNTDNKWGKPIYIQFIKGESNPAIESIFPDRGPSRGGTEVIIRGKDFRATMEGFEGKELKVYFGEAEGIVKEVSHDTIIVITPPGNPGRVEVKVENPDGSISRPSGYFTYISGPVIDRVEDPITGSRITHIPVKGGKEIKIIGKEFMEGAKVVFSPVIRKAEPGETGQIINIDGEAYILESGVEGTNFTFVNSETVLVTTPEGKLGDTGVMLINPDGGATPIYKLIYDLPGLDAPEDVIAEYVFDRYIKVHWSKVSGAHYYDVYEVVKGDEEYIGSTDLTSFLYKDVRPNTIYRFIIKAVGEYGSSKASMVSNSVTTGKNAGYEDEHGGLGEYTSIDRSGNSLYITLGRKDYKDLNVDLNQNQYKGVEEVIVSIPIDLVFSTTSDEVTITGEDYQLTFKPTAFKNSSYKKYEGDSDAGIKFTVSYNKGNTNLNNMTSLSNQLSLKGELYKDKEKQNILNLSSYMNLTMKYDTAKANLRRINNKDLYYYDENRHTWNKVSISSPSGLDKIQGLIMNLGVFTILGDRR